MLASHSASSDRPSPTQTAFALGVFNSAEAPASITFIIFCGLSAPSVPSRIMRLPLTPGMCNTKVSALLPLKSPDLINEEMAPSNDLKRAYALANSYGTVGRMRESALMFNSCAEDAVKSMFAPR